MAEDDLAIGACGNGLRDGDESDVDCGGPVCAKCGDGKGCSVDNDCGSHRCSGGVCTSCIDGMRNGSESDTDCGGSCPDCALGQKCARTTDCTSKGCVAGTCVEPLQLSLAAPATTHLPGTTLRAMTSGDFNGDGKPDLAVLDDPGRTVLVLLGRGNGQFGQPVSVGAGEFCWNLAAGDLNEDGADDLALPRLDGQLGVLLTDGLGGFLPADPRGLASPTSLVAMGDINGDHHLDVVSAASRSNNLVVLRNDGTGDFLSDVVSPVNAPSGIRSLAVGDLDGDGKGDVAVNAYSDQALVALGNAAGLLKEAFSLSNQSGGGFPALLANSIVDLDQDGRPDVLFYVGTNGRVILNDGGGKFHTGNSFPACMFADWASVGDLDGDGVPDAVMACDRTLSVLRGDGSGGVVAFPIEVKLPGRNSGLAVDDFNRDGKLDLAAIAYPDGVSLVLNTSK